MPMIVLLVLLNLLWFSKQGLASGLSSPISVASYQIPGLINKDKSGRMVELFHTIDQLTATKYQLAIFPIKRAKFSFLKQKVHGFFPVLEGYQPEQSCRTKAFMAKKIIAITLKNQPMITALDQLSGKTVGIVSGYSYGKELLNRSDMILHEVAHPEQNIKKLMAGHIDVLLGDLDASIATLEQLELLDLVHFNQPQPLYILDVFFVFNLAQNGQ